MPLYEYRAYDTRGKTTEGLVDASSRGEAFKRVRARGLFPTHLGEEKGREGQKAPGEALAFALLQLATLLEAGLPLPRALEALTSQVESRALSRTLSRVRVRVEEGDSLAGALAAEKGFPPLLVRLVEAGETVGNLPLALSRFAQFLEADLEFRRKLFGMLIYPTVVLLASLVLVGFTLSYVTPTLSEVFTLFHQKLPFSTILLLRVGQTLRPGILLALVPLVCLGIFSLRFIPLAWKDNFWLSFPVVGRVRTEIIFGQWARTLSLLLSGGIPLIRALQTAGETVGSPLIRRLLSDLEKRVERGETLSGVLAGSPRVPTFLPHIVATGEQTGQLSKMLDVVGLFYEKDVSRKLSAMLQFLEPAMILGLGATVGFVVFSILLPIFEINRFLK
ncbi:MAG: type II secretion system F family protein [Armatimonadetes bacterium]|nr:type II secretion system F family protein [Armatimonadota bacterium]